MCNQGQGYCHWTDRYAFAFARLREEGIEPKEKKILVARFQHVFFAVGEEEIIVATFIVRCNQIDGKNTDKEVGYGLVCVNARTGDTISSQMITEEETHNDLFSVRVRAGESEAFLPARLKVDLRTRQARLQIIELPRGVCKLSTKPSRIPFHTIASLTLPEDMFDEWFDSLHSKGMHDFAIIDHSDNYVRSFLWVFWCVFDMKNFCRC